MKYRPTVLGVLFLVVAAAFAGCEVLGVYEYAKEAQSGAYVLAASCMIAAIMPLLPALADWFWRDKRRMYCLSCWAAFLICLAIVLTSAIQRTGSATDGAERARIAAERAIKIAEVAARQAESDYAVAQAAALRECDVRAKRCMDAEQKAAAARAALARAREVLAAAPAGKQIDPLATRVAAYLGMTEDQYRLLQPLQVPVALSLLSVLLFAGWTRLDFAPESGGPTEAPTKAHAPQVGRPQLSVVQPPVAKFGAVAAFLVSRTEPAPGHEIEIERTMYNDYRAWCATVGVTPYPHNQFARELVGVGKVAGITIEIRGREAYCLGRRLAA